MHKTFKAFNGTITGLVLLVCNTAFAQLGGSAPSTGRSFNVTAPMTIIGNELGARMEFNTYQVGSLALDGILVSQAEEFDEKKSEEANASLISKGYEAALTFSRFSRPDMMAGFYWSLGGGYRVLDVLWSRAPNAEYALSHTFELDDDGRITHHMKASGTTVRGRLGYRYAAESWPFLAGTYVGVRHYEPKFVDVEDDENPETTTEDHLHLRKQYMSKLEAGVELGFSF
jgi:hypothetical protein